MTFKIQQLCHTARRKLITSGPAMVFTATFMLMAISIVGVVVAFLIFNVQDPKASISASQYLTLLSSAVSFTFIGLYLLAIRRNEPVSKARPPTLPLHGACFIVLRITALLWAAALVVALATKFNKMAVQENTAENELQRIYMVVPISAILATIIIMVGLESCEKPFKIPCAFMFQPRIICRVSYFDELLEQSVSRRSSYERDRRLEHQKNVLSTQSSVILCENFSATDASTRISKHSSSTKVSENVQASREYTVRAERVIQSPQPDQRVRSPRRIGPYSRYLSQPGRYTTVTSVSSKSEKASESLDMTSSSETRGPPLMASPSSSISTASHRSPLSTVRSVEDPGVPVNTDLYICPLLVPHTLDGPGVSAVPVDNIALLRRRASAGNHDSDLRKYIIKGKGKNSDAVAMCHTIHQPTSTSAKPYLDVTYSPTRQTTLEAHSKIIEDRIFTAVLRRLQEEQRLRDEAIQQQIAIAELDYLRYLESQKNRGQDYAEIISTAEPLGDVAPVLPQLDLNLEVEGTED